MTSRTKAAPLLCLKVVLNWQSNRSQTANGIAQNRTIESSLLLEMGKEPEPSKNEPNQNPGFAKNRTKHEPQVYKTRTENEYNFSEVLRARTEPNPYYQKTRTEHESKILGSFPSLVVTAALSTQLPQRHIQFRCEMIGLNYFEIRNLHRRLRVVCDRHGKRDRSFYSRTNGKRCYISLAKYIKIHIQCNKFVQVYGNLAVYPQSMTQTTQLKLTLTEHSLTADTSQVHPKNCEARKQRM